MSSNLTTYFVVAYDHVDGRFYIDDGMASIRFNRDTWDDDEGEWVYLNHTGDVVEELSDLRHDLEITLEKGQPENE